MVAANWHAAASATHCTWLTRAQVWTSVLRRRPAGHLRTRQAVQAARRAAVAAPARQQPHVQLPPVHCAGGDAESEEDTVAVQVVCCQARSTFSKSSSCRSCPAGYAGAAAFAGHQDAAAGGGRLHAEAAAWAHRPHVPWHQASNRSQDLHSECCTRRVILSMQPDLLVRNVSGITCCRMLTIAASLPMQMARYVLCSSGDSYVISPT